MSLDFWTSMCSSQHGVLQGYLLSLQLLMCPECRTGGFKSWRKTWMSPRSSPPWACQLPLVGSAFLERSIQGKANWVKGSDTSPVKNDSSGSSPVAPLQPFPAVLHCKASPQLLGQQSPTYLVFGHSSAVLPSSRSTDPSFSLSEPGRKLSVGHCCSHGAKLGGDADLLLMLFQTSEIVSKSKPCFKAQS